MNLPQAWRPWAARVEEPERPPSPVPVALAQGITAAFARSLQRSRPEPRFGPHDRVYASASDDCVRAMTYDLAGAPRPSFDAETLARLDRGEARETDLIIRLERAGREADPPFQIIGQQERFELRDRKGRVAISGKVDARLRIRHPEIAAPIEIKTWAPWIVERIERFEDLFAIPWTRRGAFQLLAYLYGASEPFGFLILDRAGLPAILPVELERHLDAMEDFLSRAEVAIDHARAGTLPPYLENDPAACARCAYFGSVCNPPQVAEGAIVLDDPALESSLERHAELKAAGEEFERLDREIKKRLRGIEHGIAGSFAIEGRWGNYTRLELPAEVKARYSRNDPRGRFTLNITKVQP